MAFCPPNTHLLRAMRNVKLTWRVILGEFIDNAFDAGASKVGIALEKKRLVVEDDGRGCANPLDMVWLGKHTAGDDTRLGRYGIGCKDAAVSAAKTIRIETICECVKRTLDTDWEDLERSGKWNYPDPTARSSTDPSGTTLTLQPLRGHKILDKSRLSELRQALGVQYMPAIVGGKTIILNGEPVQPYRMPYLEKSHVANLEVDGRRSRVLIGLVPRDTTLIYPNLLMSLDFRVIETGKRLGFENRPTQGLCGWIQLQEGWEPSKNKDYVSSDLSALGEAISRVPEFQVIIDEAARRSQSIVFSNVSRTLNDALSKLDEIIHQPRRKAKRDSPENETGPVRPTGEGPKHRRALRTQLGDAFEALEEAARHGLQVTFEKRGEQGPVAEVSQGNIILNEDVPFIQQHQHDEQMVMIHALYAVSQHIILVKGMAFPFDEMCKGDSERICRLVTMLMHHVVRTTPASALVEV